MCCEEISLPFLLVITIVLISYSHAQPQSWNDVCVQGTDPVTKMAATNCYLWTGAPFPFNDIGSFVKNNPFCPLTAGQKCNIYISPVLINCQVSPYNDPRYQAPNGCQFYKPTNISTTAYNVILCNLAINCGSPDPTTFLPLVYQTFYNNITSPAFANAVTAYAISSIFGGPGLAPGPNSQFLSSIFGTQVITISTSNPPAVRIRWTGPISITTPSITMDSMWAVANLYNNSIPYIAVNVQIMSPLNTSTPNAYPSCTIFTITSSSVSFNNIIFYVDPLCSQPPYLNNTQGGLVYLVPSSTSLGIGNVILTNLSSSPTTYPIVYILDNYQTRSSLLIDFVLFDSSLDGTKPPPPPGPPTQPLQMTIPYASIILQYGGQFFTDLASPGFFFGPRMACYNENISNRLPCTNATFVNAWNWTNVDTRLLGCTPIAYSNSVCDQKNATDLGLVISTSILLATLVLYFLVYFFRKRRNTLANAIGMSANAEEEEDCTVCEESDEDEAETTRLELLARTN